MEIKEKWENELREYIENEKEKLFARWCGWILYRLNHFQLYEFVAEYEEPWDYSGDVRKLPGNHFNEIKTVGEFFELRTGNRTASYTSGCGWFFDTWEDSFDYDYDNDFYGLMIEWVEGKDENEWNEWILQENGEFQTKEEWSEWDPNGSSLGDEVDLIRWDWKSEIKDLTIDEVKKSGEFIYKQLLKEAAEEERIAELKRIEKQKKIDYGNELWDIIEQNGFKRTRIEQRNKSDLFKYTKALDFTKEQLKAMALARSYLFSNSLYYDLTK